VTTRDAGAVGVYPGSFDPLTVAHMAIAEAAVRAADLDRIDLVLSSVALGKEDGGHASVDARANAIRRAARTRPWLAVTTTDQQLIAEIASGYDVVVMGADKWAQVFDPGWYGGSEAARDLAVARLPTVAVVARPGVVLPEAEALGGVLLIVDDQHADVSSSAARGGRTEWMLPEAADFDARTGAWSDADRYARWSE
jgi:hypothetical protein